MLAALSLLGVAAIVYSAVSMYDLQRGSPRSVDALVQSRWADAGNMPATIMPGGRLPPDELENPTAAPAYLPTSSASVSPPGRLPFAPSLSPTSPPASGMLLFLVQGQLKSWTPGSHQARPLARLVESYSANPLLRMVILARNQKVTANGVMLYSLERLDLDSLAMQVLIQEMRRVQGVTISADGQRVAFVEDGNPARVYFMPTQAGAAQAAMGECQATLAPGQTGEGCGGLAWAPDNRRLAWSDDRGVWVAGLQENSARLAHSAELQVHDPSGQINRIKVRFSALRWSPDGRYLLLRVKPLASAVAWQAILDPPTGRLVEIPDSFEFASLSAALSWTPAGELLMAHPTAPGSANAVEVKRWRIVATSKELLKLVQHIAAPTTGFQALAGANAQDSTYCPSGLAIDADQAAHLEIDQLSRAAVLQETGQAALQGNSYLLSLSLEDGAVLTLTHLTFKPRTVDWAPDGSGALLVGGNQQVYWMYTDGHRMIDLSAIVGAGAHSFTWLSALGIHIP